MCSYNTQPQSDKKRIYSISNYCRHPAVGTENLKESVPPRKSWVAGILWQTFYFMLLVLLASRLV